MMIYFIYSNGGEVHPHSGDRTARGALRGYCVRVAMTGKDGKGALLSLLSRRCLGSYRFIGKTHKILNRFAHNNLLQSPRLYIPRLDP